MEGVTSHQPVITRTSMEECPMPPILLWLPLTPPPPCLPPWMLWREEEAACPSLRPTTTRPSPVWPPPQPPPCQPPPCTATKCRVMGQSRASSVNTCPQTLLVSGLYNYETMTSWGKFCPLYWFSGESSGRGHPNPPPVLLFLYK